MSEKNKEMADYTTNEKQPISEFTESYASFNRIINNLQRQYLELREEFTAQNEQLAETNRQLLEMTRRNLEATEFLNGLLTSITAGIIAVDQEGRITHFNPAASALFGIPQREPLGKLYREAIPPGQPVDANALRAVETGRALDSVEKELVLPDGTHLYLSISTAILRDQDGKSNGAVEVLHDLTKIKKMEREISRLNTLAALGEMAATIAHEVRNPLAAIGGFAALLKRDMDPDDGRRKLVSKICHGVDSLNNTVTALLNYTRIEEVKKEEVDYGDFLRQTLEQFRYEYSEHIGEMQFDLSPTYGQGGSPILLSLDPMLIRQSLHNLFTNAVEACGGCGQVTIKYHVMPRQQATRLYGDRIMIGLDETVVATSVEDSGPGIAEGIRDKLFAPFFTTRQGGTGLGLAVVWKVIKAHGGEVIAEDGRTGGARFVVLLPVKISRAENGQADTRE